MAAEGTDSKRQSLGFPRRPPSQMEVNRQMEFSRMTSPRNSYYGGNSVSGGPRNTRPGGYYRHSSYGFLQGANYGENPQGPNPGYYNRPPRHHSAPYTGENTMTPGHYHQMSYETMTTLATANSDSDQATKSTDPSSHNSSTEFHEQARKNGMHGEDYRFGDSPSSAYGPGFASPISPTDQYPRGAMPPPPPPNNPRMPIKLNSGPSDVNEWTNDSAKAPKRQSWIRRKFSRRDS